MVNRVLTDPAASGRRASVALIFPPLTEARLFPYLSLPALTAYLRQHGVEVEQRDFNIELCHRLITPVPLQGLYQRLTARPPSLKNRYRLALCDYLLRHHEVLNRSVFTKTGASAAGKQHDVRFTRNGVELLVEDSALRVEIEDFDSIDRLVSTFDADSDDCAAHILRQMLDETVHSGLKVLGISVAFFSQLPSALLLARWAKQLHPDLFVVLGGPHVVLWHQRLQQLSVVRACVDGLCTGPGEQCLLELVRAIFEERPPDGVPELLLVRRDYAPPPRSQVHINELPVPDFNGLPVYGYLAEEAHLCLTTCVGCYWGRCIFCSYGNRSADERGYQQASPDWIARACKQLVARHGISRINFVDENTNLRAVSAAVRRLNDDGVRIEFSTRNRLESILLDRAFCHELMRQGCVLMSAGYETNSQRLLDKLDKGVRADHYQTIIDNLHVAGIPLRLSIMGGILDETEQERDDSLAFLERNADRIGIDIMQMLVAEPKTRLSRALERHGLRRTRPGLRGNRLLNYGLGRVGYDFDYVDGDTFGSRLQAFTEFFHRIRPQKNDELSPDQRGNGLPDMPPNMRGVLLWPWVQILSGEAGDASVIVDLLWERFYQLPMKVDNVRMLAAPPGRTEVQGLMRSLIRLGVVETVYFE